MRMKSFRKLLFVWMIVWLPVAGALATAMPLTGPIGAMSAPSDATVGDPGLFAEPCHGVAKAGNVDFGQGCEHCALCHLAGALVMPEIPLLATFVPSNIYIAVPRALHPSFVPEPISPPPRALAPAI